MHTHKISRTICPFAVDTLERKIALLNKMKPKSLDDFAPLLKINEQDLKNIVYKRVLNEIHDVGKYENGIYYMSDKLQVRLSLLLNWQQHRSKICVHSKMYSLG